MPDPSIAAHGTGVVASEHDEVTVGRNAGRKAVAWTRLATAHIYGPIHASDARRVPVWRVRHAELGVAFVESAGDAVVERRLTARLTGAGGVAYLEPVAC